MIQTTQRGSPPLESVRRVALASMVGTSIEWYDFFIFGTASALVFGRLFFPTFSELAGTLAAFASFAVGFVARPVGGLVFGHIGDRSGRKTTLVLTLTMMGLATFAMGLMPSYAASGAVRCLWRRSTPAASGAASSAASRRWAAPSAG
jgi:MHS family shikimate/dehydroshikimate transporter-like MFS transporter